MAYVENAPHNPEVVGSNPAPATKNLQLVGLAGELFVISGPCFRFNSQPLKQNLDL